MPLTMVNSITVQAGNLRTVTDAVAELASRAVEIADPFRWSGYQVLFGNAQILHFSYQAEDFEALGAAGSVEDLWIRVLGREAGEAGLQRVNACVEAVQHTISVDRPDLSYPPPEQGPMPLPLAIVTRAQVQPGGEDACEELIRKLAEAIPKVDDSTRIITHQTLIGNAREYWTVRPVASFEELDQQLPLPELLNRAFGASEGGLIWRAGNEAIANIQRQIVEYRPEISNPAS